MANLNFGNAASGALSGGALGATFGAPGAAIGAAGGGLLGLLGMGKGSKNKMKPISNFDPMQQALHNQQGQALQQGGGYGNLISMLQNMLDPDSAYYKDFENAQMNQFNEQILPGIGERFGGGFGSESGALSSSGFGQALGGAAAGLQSNLGMMKQQGVQGALSQLLGQYQQFQNQKPFMYNEKPGSAGLFDSMLPGLASGFGEALPGILQSRWGK